MQAAHHLPEPERFRVSPLLGNVAFASGRYGFCFTLSSFSKKYGAENVIVRGLTNTMPYTFKSYGETSLNFQEFHEYFENRVKDTSQFEYFYNIEIQVRVF